MASALILPPGVEVAVAEERPAVYPPGAPGAEPVAGTGMVVNETDLPDRVIETYLEEHATVLGLSPGNTYATYIAQGSLLTRPKFRVPTSVMEEIILARDLAERDDDVAATIGAMEAMAFGDGMQNAHEDEVVVAMFDKISRKAKLLGRFKEMYREYLIAAQCTIATVLIREDISFMPMGADRQRTRSVLTPRIGVIPSEQIRVLGNDLFGTAQLAYRPFSGRQENWLIEYFSQDTSPGRKAEMRREDPILTTLLTEMVAWDNQKDGGSTWVYGDPLDPVIGHYVWLMDERLVQRACMPKGQWAHPRPLLARNFPLLEAKRLLSIMDYCQDLSSEILTRDGWRRHDEVRAGDETIGYNPLTGCAEWTRISRVHHLDDVPFVRIANGSWSARVSPAHRWWAEKRVDHGVRGAEWVGGFVRTDEINSRHRLLLAAALKAKTGPRPGRRSISEPHARLIAWAYTDGSIQASRSTRTSVPKFEVVIAQKKAKQRGNIRRLLKALKVPYSVYVRPDGVHLFRLEPQAARKLWRTADLPLVEKKDLPPGTLVQWVLGLTGSARKGFLEAAFQAEGTRDPHGAKLVAQNQGELLDALVLATYLSGYMPKLARTGSEDCRVLRRGRPRVGGARLTREDNGHGPAWCVETELGTWTMRQGDQISLTGNSLLEAGANFLVVAKKGTDARPALPEEIANLRDTLKRATRSGVMIGDHRLDIEIITPQLDELLNPAKRKLLGRKLAAAILRLPDFQSADAGSGQSVLTDTEIISRVVTSDRDDLRLLVEEAVYEMVADRNGDSLAGPATIWFPKIILQGLQYFTQLVLGLRDRGDIPRKYAVEAAGFNYTAAVQQRKLEKASGDDKILTPPPVPFSTPNGGQDLGFIPGNGRPPGSGPNNGAPGARSSSQPAKPASASKNAPRANEEVKAMFDEDSQRVVRAGERTYELLESYLDTTKIGRLTRAESRALRQIEENARCGILEEGAFTVVPVNPDYELEEISAVRLAAGGPTMWVGRRVDDGAVLARALVFRDHSKLDAEEAALRWGFEIAREDDD